MSITLWLLVSVICIIIELMTTSLTTIWFAIGALVGALFSLLNLNLAFQIVGCAVVALISLFLLRPIFKKSLMKIENTNIDSLIGEVIYVLQEINNMEGRGQVKLNGIEWSARSNDDSIISVGKKVVVREIKGVRVFVEEIKEVQKQEETN